MDPAARQASNEQAAAQKMPAVSNTPSPKSPETLPQSPDSVPKARCFCLTSGMLMLALMAAAIVTLFALGLIKFETKEAARVMQPSDVISGPVSTTVPPDFNCTIQNDEYADSQIPEPFPRFSISAPFETLCSQPDETPPEVVPNASNVNERTEKPKAESGKPLTDALVLKPVLYTLKMGIKNVVMDSGGARKRPRKVILHGKLILTVQRTNHQDRRKFRINLDTAHVKPMGPDLQWNQTMIVLRGLNNMSCFRRIQQVEENMLEFEMTEALVSDEYFDIIFPDFESHVDLISHPRHQIVHFGGDLQKGFSLTTNFPPVGKDSIFPSFDDPTLKARFKLIVSTGKHERQFSASSLEGCRSRHLGEYQTQFATTPPILTSSSTFAIFSEMVTVQKGRSSIILPRNPRHKKEIPYRESGKLENIMEFSNQLIALMEKLTETRCPSDNLTFIIPYGMATYDGVGNFGLITLSSKLMMRIPPNPHDEGTRAPTAIAYQVIKQWLGNLVSVSAWGEMCLQDGLANYLTLYIIELLNKRIGEKDRYENLQTIAISSDDSIQNVIASRTRQNALTLTGGFLRIWERELSIGKSRCYFKPIMIFNMISKAAVQQTFFKDLLTSLFSLYKYGNAGRPEWHKAFVAPENSHLSSVDSDKTGFDKKLSQDQKGTNFVVPIDIYLISEDGKQQTLVANQQMSKSNLLIKTEVEFQVHRLILDPRGVTLARNLYPMSNYAAHLKACFDPSGSILADRKKCGLNIQQSLYMLLE